MHDASVHFTPEAVAATVFILHDVNRWTLPALEVTKLALLVLIK